VYSLSPVDGVLPVLLTGMLAAGENTVEADRPDIAMAGQGLFCK
jgi:hypothetical protein